MINLCNILLLTRIISREDRTFRSARNDLRSSPDVTWGIVGPFRVEQSAIDPIRIDYSLTLGTSVEEEAAS